MLAALRGYDPEKPTRKPFNPKDSFANDYQQSVAHLQPKHSQGIQVISWKSTSKKLQHTQTHALPKNWAPALLLIQVREMNSLLYRAEIDSGSSICWFLLCNKSGNFSVLLGISRYRRNSKQCFIAFLNSSHRRFDSFCLLFFYFTIRSRFLPPFFGGWNSSRVWNCLTSSKLAKFTKQVALTSCAVQI